MGGGGERERGSIRALSPGVIRGSGEAGGGARHVLPTKKGAKKEA